MMSSKNLKIFTVNYVVMHPLHSLQIIAMFAFDDNQPNWESNHGLQAANLQSSVESNSSNH
jgi:hypothetical protein